MSIDASTATGAAREYLKEVAGFGFITLKECIRKDSVWEVTFDTGVYQIRK